MDLPEQVKKFGWVGERKALALLCLGFYATIFTVMGLIAMAQLPEWMACFFALAAVYTIAFFAVAAEWFWGRWFAVGLGSWGLTMAVMAMVMTWTFLPQMAVLGAMHGLIWVCLLGEKMAASYDAKPEWRARWNLDDQGAIKIQRAVTRTAASLPYLIFWVLAPRDGQSLAVLAVAAVGLFGLLRGRTWGVLAIGGAGVAALASAWLGGAGYFYDSGMLEIAPAQFSPQVFAAAGGALLLAATAPFAAPIIRWMRQRIA